MFFGSTKLFKVFDGDVVENYNREVAKLESEIDAINEHNYMEFHRINAKIIEEVRNEINRHTSVYVDTDDVVNLYLRYFENKGNIKSIKDLERVLGRFVYYKHCPKFYNYIVYFSNKFQPFDFKSTKELEEKLSKMSLKNYFPEWDDDFNTPTDGILWGGVKFIYTYFHKILQDKKGKPVYDYNYYKIEREELQEFLNVVKKAISLLENKEYDKLNELFFVRNYTWLNEVGIILKRTEEAITEFLTVWNKDFVVYFE